MKKLDQKGNSLLLVLLTITLISIFGTVLSTQALSTTKQVKQTEGNQKATDAAEMGIEDFYRKLKSQFATLDLSTISCSTIEAKANNLIAQPVFNQEYLVDGTTNTFYTGTHSSSPCIKINDQTFEYSFKSIGKVIHNGNEVTKELTATFPIRATNLFPPRPEGFIDETECTTTTNCLETDTDRNETTVKYLKDVYFDELILDKKQTTIAESLYIDGTMTISGNNDESFELTVEDNLYINGNSQFNNFAKTLVKGNYYLNGQFGGSNHAELYVDQDAFFYGDILQKPHNFICVEGTLSVTQATMAANISEPFIFDLDTNVSPGPFSSCTDAKTKLSGANGNGTEITKIYARNIRVFEQNSNIGINDNDLLIEY